MTQRPVQVQELGLGPAELGDRRLVAATPADVASVSSSWPSRPISRITARISTKWSAGRVIESKPSTPRSSV